MDNVVEIKNVYKKFNVYIDKRKSFKEKILFPKSNQYTERVVLDGVSLNIKKGEAVGLVGRNGCGKSTLLKLISKIMYPEKGSVEVKGRISSLIELGAGFHPDMSGRENIFTNASILGLSKKQIEERLAQIIEFSELGDFIDNPVRTYSSGMYMRLAFAVAINVDADVLLIDEILAVGDVSFQKKCFDKLKSIKAKGTTIVIVSHSLGQIEKICDRSYWIENGKIVCHGNPKNVHKKYLEFMNEGIEEMDDTLELLESNEKVEEEKKEATQEIVVEEVKEEEIQESVVEEEKKEEVQESVVEEVKEEAKEEQKEDDIEFIEENIETIKKTEKRWGNKEAQIQIVELLDDNGVKKDTFKTGENISIKIPYTSVRKIKNAVAGIGIFREDGTYCYGTNTLIDNLKGVTLNKEGEIICKIKNELLEGKYLLDVALHTVDAIDYDYYREAAVFNVVSNKRDTGVARLEHYWKY